MIIIPQVEMGKVSMNKCNIRHAQYSFRYFCMCHKVFTLLHAIIQAPVGSKYAAARQNFPMPLPISSIHGIIFRCEETCYFLRYA